MGRTKKDISVGIKMRVSDALYRQVEAALADAPKKIPGALNAAVNRTVATVKTTTIRSITDTINIRRKDIDGDAAGVHRYGGVTLYKSVPTTLAAKVAVTGKRIPVYRFGVAPRPPADQKGVPVKDRQPRGVSYRISKGGGRKHIAQAFVAKMKSGHVGVFARAGGRRGKRPALIVEQFGPSIPHVALESPQLAQALNVDANEVLEKNVMSQLDRLIRGGAALA